MKIKSSNNEYLTVPDGMEAAAMEAQANGTLAEFAESLKKTSMKKGGMLKRKDGSYSRRGLWDNIRANRGSGKKPTKKMLEQERKIRAKQAAGGVVFKGYVTEQPISEPVPFHTSTIGEKMGKGGYTVKRSSARKGKTHVVIGPDGTKKYFGDSKLGQHPKDPGRKKSFYARHAKNLKNNPYFRAFARATWADGGKLGQGIYDMGLMPYGMGGHTQEGPMSQLYAPHTGESVDIRYADGGYIFAPKMDYDGRINDYGRSTLAYNERERMLFGGLFGKMKENKGFLGDLARNPLETAKDLGKASVDIGLSTAGAVTGIKALKNVVGQDDYRSGGLKGIDDATSGIGDLAGTALKFIPVTAPFANAASAVGGLANTAFGIDKKNYTPEGPQSTFEKITGGIKQAGDIAGMFVNPASAAGNIGKAAQIAGQVGKYAGLANMGLGLGQQLSSGQGINPMQLLQLGMAASKSGMFGGGNQGGGNTSAISNIDMSGQPGDIGTQGQGMFGMPTSVPTVKHGGYVRMANGGQTGLVPINVEGANFSQGSGPDAKKGELLVINGKIIKNYVGRPPHPTEGQNPMGNDDAPEGLIVIPKARTAEYLEAGLEKRKQIERSLVSQQQDREMKKSRKMGDGGYYSFGMGEMGMADGGPIGNPEIINDITYGTMKKGGWIQKATASIKRRGTEGVCTGSKFGSSSCPPGSRRYNLAKTFRKMARSKKEYGGFVDPVTGSPTVMYAAGGQLPEGLLRTRMKASGASPEEINRYVAAKYEMGGPTNVDRSAIYAGMRSRFNYGGRTMMQPGGSTYTDIGSYNDFVNSTFEANNPYYILPSNFSMLDAEAQRKAAGQRAGQIVNQAQSARMASAPRANYFTTTTNPYYSGTSGSNSMTTSSSATPKITYTSPQTSGPFTKPNIVPYDYAGSDYNNNYEAPRLAAPGTIRENRNFYDYDDPGTYVPAPRTSTSSIDMGFKINDQYVDPDSPPMDYVYNGPGTTVSSEKSYSDQLANLGSSEENYTGPKLGPIPGDNSNFVYTGPGSVARMQDPKNWSYTNDDSGPKDWKGTPYAYPANTPGGTTPPPASNSSYLDPDVRRAMRAYGIAGGIYGLSQIGEGLFSKAERYKRMLLNRQRPELLNPREALADERRQAAALKYARRQTGDSYAGLTAGSSDSSANRARIHGLYDNANAQIRNAYKDALVRDQMALMQQDQYAQMFDAQARAARRNMIRSGLGDLAGTAGNYANMAIQNKYLGKMGSAGNLG